MPLAELLLPRGETFTRSSSDQVHTLASWMILRSQPFLFCSGHLVLRRTSLSLRRAALSSLLALLFSKLLRSSGLNGYHEERQSKTRQL